MGNKRMISSQQRRISSWKERQPCWSAQERALLSGGLLFKGTLQNNVGNREQLTGGLGPALARVVESHPSTDGRPSMRRICSSTRPLPRSSLAVCALSKVRLTCGIPKKGDSDLKEWLFVLLAVQIASRANNTSQGQRLKSRFQRVESPQKRTVTQVPAPLAPSVRDTKTLAPAMATPLPGALLDLSCLVKHVPCRIQLSPRAQKTSQP